MADSKDSYNFSSAVLVVSIVVGTAFALACTWKNFKASLESPIPSTPLLSTSCTKEDKKKKKSAKGEKPKKIEASIVVKKDVLIKGEEKLETLTMVAVKEEEIGKTDETDIILLASMKKLTAVPAMKASSPVIPAISTTKLKGAANMINAPKLSESKAQPVTPPKFKVESPIELAKPEPTSRSSQASDGEDSWVSVTKKGEISESSISARLKKSVEELEDLKSSYSHVKKSYDETIVKSQSLERELKSVYRNTETKISALESEIIALKTRNASLTTVVAEFQVSAKKAESAKSSLDALEAKNNQLMTENRTLEMQNENLSLMLCETEQETKRLSKEVQVYSAYPPQLEVAHSQIQSLESKLNDIETSHQSVVNAIQNHNKEREAVSNEEVKLLNMKVASLEADLLQKEKDQETRISQLNATIESRTIALSHAMSDLEGKISQNTMLQRQLESQLPNKNSLDEKLEALNLENAQIREANSLIGRYLENCMNTKCEEP